MRGLALCLIFLAGPVLAAEKYLAYPDMAACLERSRQQCVAQGCDGVSTRYWWRCDEIKDGSAVLVIEPYRTDFNVTRKGAGLTAQEQGKLTETKPAQAGVK